MFRNNGVLLISIGFWPNVGGLETHLNDLVEYLSKKRIKVYVATLQPLCSSIKTAACEIGRNKEIYRVDWFGRKGKWFNHLCSFPPIVFFYLAIPLTYLTLKILITKRKYIKVVHCQGFITSIPALVFGKLFGKKIVVSTHSIYYIRRSTLFGKFMKIVLSCFDKILCLSKQSRTEIANIGIDERKLEVFTYWVDLEKFYPLDKYQSKEKLGWAQDMTILFVGRYVEVKGIEELLQATKMLQDLSINFIFVGDGPLQKEIDEEARHNDRVFNLGKVDNAQLLNYYNGADVLIVPSKNEEGFGRVILEALACGTPVVASSKGGILEALDESVGYFIKVLCPEEIAKTIKGIYNSKEQLRKKTERCRPYAEKRFSEINAKVFLESYGLF